MGVWHYVEVSDLCPRCGPFKERIRLDYGGVDHGAVYRMGDRLPWTGVPHGVRDSRLKYWPLGESVQCPSCGDATRFAHAILIEDDVLKRIIWLPPDAAELPRLPPVALLLAIEEFGYVNVKHAAAEKNWYERLTGWALPQPTVTNELQAEWICPACSRSMKGVVALRYGPIGPYRFHIGESIDWSRPGWRPRPPDHRVAYLDACLPACECSYEGRATVVVGADRIEQLYVLPKDLWEIAATASAWYQARGSGDLDYQPSPAVTVFLLVRQYGEAMVREELEKISGDERFDTAEWNILRRVSAGEIGLLNAVALRIEQQIELAANCHVCGNTRLLLPFLYGDQRPHRKYRVGDEITWGGGPIDYFEGGTRDSRMKYVFLHGDWQTCHTCNGTRIGREPAVIVERGRISEARLSPMRSTGVETEMEDLGYSYELEISQRERLLLVEAYGADSLARAFIRAFQTTLAGVSPPWPDEASWLMRRKLFAILDGFQAGEVGVANKIEVRAGCPKCGRPPEQPLEFPYGRRAGTMHRVGDRVGWDARAPIDSPRDPRVSYRELTWTCRCGFQSTAFVTIAADVIESMLVLPADVGDLDPGYPNPGGREEWRRPWHDGESWSHRMFLLIREYGWERVRSTAMSIPECHRYGAELDFRLASGR